MKGDKLKFEKRTYYKDKDWIYLIPSVEIRRDAHEYGCPNLTIVFHFMIWHFRWFWIDREGRFL